MKELVFDKLASDESLCALVGRIKGADRIQGDIPCIFFNNPASWDVLPAVAFMEQDGGDVVFADDICVAVERVIQIDVVANTSATLVFERVDFLLRQMGFVCKQVMDIIEPVNKHKRGIYKILTNP